MHFIKVKLKWNSFLSVLRNTVYNMSILCSSVSFPGPCPGICHLVLILAWGPGNKATSRIHNKQAYIKHLPASLTYPSRARRLWLCPCSYQDRSSVPRFLPPRLCAADHDSETEYQQLSLHPPSIAPPCCSEGGRSGFYCSPQIPSPVSLSWFQISLRGWSKLRWILSYGQRWKDSDV